MDPFEPRWAQMFAKSSRDRPVLVQEVVQQTLKRFSGLGI